jgi:hypothetical protein
MLSLRGRRPRALSSLHSLCQGLASTTGLAVVALLGAGCLQEPAPELRYQRLDASGEVFRVFCKRVARAAYSQDASGDRFYALCDGADFDGTMAEPADEPDTMLRTLAARRPQVIAALRQTFAEGDTLVEGTLPYEENELSSFLSALVPLYDLPDERIPNATRDIADLFNRVINLDDPKAVSVVDTVARLSERQGYRSPQLVLGAIRPILSYEGLDKLAQLLLGVVGEEGAAHDEWLNLLRAASLELADDPVKVDPIDSTLRVALQLLFKTDATLAGPSGALPVLKREAGGAASAAGGGPVVDGPTPFFIADRTDDKQDRNKETLAVLRQPGQADLPLYDTFDANQTIFSAVMRETSKLIDRAGEERAGVESIAHGVRPLLGPWGARSEKIGQNNYTFMGPNVDESPLLELVHALAQTARYSETEAMLQVLTQLLQKNESEATAAVFGGLAINERSKKLNDAKLNGPHEFWDDVIQAANQILEREGLLEALVRTFENPQSAQQGPLFANWMLHNDVVTYKNAPIEIDPPVPYTEAQKNDINELVKQPLMAAVDRGASDTGMNRSIWQRTMSLINALNGQKVCNKKGAILNVPTALGLFVFPAGNPAGYEECAFIEFNDAVEIYSLAVLGKAKVTLKDDVALGLAALGGTLAVVGSVPDITEKESQLTGFRDTITPQSTARFIFAPPNKFISDLFSPLLTREGVPIKDYEPYALFPMENPDADAGGETFISLGKLLLQAFDDHETRDADGKLPKGYMFGNLLSVLHKHWPSRHMEACAGTFPEGSEGCTQSADPTEKFYVPGTNLVSYEQLIAESFKEEDYLGILHRATVALKALSYQDKDGVKVLSDFVTRLLTPDASLRTRDGKAYTKTNLCVEITGPDGQPACKDNVGRIIPQLTPLYLVLDALKKFDTTWEQEKDRHDAWLAGRSKLVDQLLTVDRSGAAGSYSYKLADRNAYAIAVAALPWVSEQVASHRAKNDLEAWSGELSGRLAKVLRHPLAAGTLDLLDAFWDEPEASGEFTKVSATVLNEDTNPADFRGMLVSAADLLSLLDSDQDLSPAIQFAALALAPNAFEAVGSNAAPEVEKSAAYAGLELTREVVNLLMEKKGDAEYTTLAKLLRNSVLSDGSARSPLEVIFDAVADVNRIDTAAPTAQSLTAEEDRQVFGNIKGFLFDTNGEKRSLERLYSVIQSRTLTDNK